MMGGVRLVTLSGDLIESSGGMHGGSRRRTARPSEVEAAKPRNWSACAATSTD